MKIAGNGTGDTRWKVRDVLDWSTMTLNPHVDVTKETTTLYASDRDVFVLPVDDTNHDQSGAVSGWITGLVFPGLLLLEQRGRQKDAWYCPAFISARSA